MTKIKKVPLKQTGMKRVKIPANLIAYLKCLDFHFVEFFLYYDETN